MLALRRAFAALHGVPVERVGYRWQPVQLAHAETMSPQHETAHASLFAGPYALTACVATEPEAQRELANMLRDEAAALAARADSVRRELNA